MQAAKDLGISLKRFQGWEPRTVVEYQYDNGRVSRTISTTESEWDDTERAWMLALHVYNTDRCQGCGGRWSETTDPENEDAYTTDAIRCHACTARSIAVNASSKVLHPDALFRVVRRVDDD